MPFINNLDDKLIHSLMKKEIENYEIETQVSNLKHFCIHSIFCIILIQNSLFDSDRQKYANNDFINVIIIII